MKDKVYLEILARRVSREHDELCNWLHPQKDVEENAKRLGVPVFAARALAEHCQQLNIASNRLYEILDGE